MIVRQTAISNQMVDFARFLRTKRFNVSPERLAWLMQSLPSGVNDPQLFKLIVRSIFVQDKSQQDRFDGLFEEYFKELKQGQDAKIKQSPRQERQVKNATAHYAALKNWLHGNKESDDLASFGGAEQYYFRDFKTFDEGDVQRFQKEIKNWLKRVKPAESRRKKLAKRAMQPDLSLTFRKNLRKGAEIKRLYFQEPKRQRIRLVILCDISRSMELYTRFFMQFLFAFKQVFPRIETFFFSSGLYRVTHDLENENYEEVLAKFSEQSSAWSGSTAIGQVLQQFLTGHQFKHLDKKTIFLVLSDGLGMGDAELVSSSMEAIKKRVKKVVWLNPLAGSPNYEMRTDSMLAARPYIDQFASGDNFESLKSVILGLYKRSYRFVPSGRIIQGQNLS
ncbi:VWA domain-containing protein [Marinilongibacter aquaticus]|uniref:vWA domain-containing protein n=1 Tax=Marinilongibacter aquaticus TaxID=2975157 RepID=UPI0021BDDE9C|nr:VWA domain-containing protein [Marinilongibacter aquaticus]UBM57422.1 VWA domain-containing protein [Marinilongibacter aquaticus]